MRNKKIFVIIAAFAAAIGTAAFFIKRHAGKSKYAACALIAVFMLCGASVTAYAKTDPEPDPDCEIDVSIILVPIVTTPEPTPPPDP